MTTGFDDSRSRSILGDTAMELLSQSRVAVFGIGGVGGHLCEALARGGIGHLCLIDGDTVSPSNINRQIVALSSNVGMKKVDVMKQRIRDINPNCQVEALPVFYSDETADGIDLRGFDYIADAIDDVKAKISLIVRAKASDIPIISATGAGNKLYPERFEIADLSKTYQDPLAKVMRHELAKVGIKHLTVVFSPEQPVSAYMPDEPGSGDRPRRAAPGSLSYVPGVMGMIMAGEIIRSLSGIPV